MPHTPTDPVDDDADVTRTRQVIGRIALAVLLILLIPIFLYAIAPDEPFKAGVVVFANGTHHAVFVDPTAFQALGYEHTCVLEPKEQLVILQAPIERPDGTIKARTTSVGGTPTHAFPFCPPHAEILVKPHQVVQKPSVWGEIKETLLPWKRH